MTMIMHNRYLLLTLLLLSVSVFTASAGNLRERVYLSTDRNVYVAGDALYCSAYCMDVNTGRLSDFSGIAYFEIHSGNDMVQTGKIAVRKGRGCGRITLLNTIPTGNYKIVAYTSQSRNEPGFDYDLSSKTISIFNTLSTARVEGGVDVVADDSYPPARPMSPAADGNDIGMEVRTDSSADGYFPVKITNNSSETVFMNVGIRHIDGIASPENKGIAGFVAGVRGIKGTSPEFIDNYVPEYEGEVIRARVSGMDQAGLAGIAGKYAFFSTPGETPSTYSSVIGEDGTVNFFTDNLYGDREAFLEIEGLAKDQVCHLELESPFIDVKVTSAEKLAICPGLAADLEMRSASMQISQYFDSDTLFEKLPVGNINMFDDRAICYNLDDYTRFPVMEELFIEYIKEARVVRDGGSRQIQVRIRESGTASYVNDKSLMMVDGIPVYDHEKILEYDPLLVERIDIYPSTYVFGIRSFTGVINFITYKRSLPSMSFDDNVRIVNFQGPAYPQAFTCSGVSDSYPDYRQTLYWQPLVEIKPGACIEFKCKLPSYNGNFEIFAEGISSNGDAVTGSMDFLL